MLFGESVGGGLEAAGGHVGVDFGFGTTGGDGGETGFEGEEGGGKIGGAVEFYGVLFCRHGEGGGVVKTEMTSIAMS